MRRTILRLAFAGAVVGVATGGAPVAAQETPSSQEELPASSEYVLNCMQPLGWHMQYTEFKCPIGGESFRSLVLGTHSTYGRHLDWKPISYMDFPAPVPVCPSSGFVMYKPEFSDDELKRYRSVVEGDRYKKLFSEKHASFYLLAKFLEYAGEENEGRWWQLLQATWEADSCKSDKYALYAGETIGAAKTRLATAERSDQLYWILNIIIPNLHRRTGDFDKAGDWLDKLDRQGLAQLEDKEFFDLAFSLLEKAIAEKNTAQIEIRKPDKETRE